MESSIIKMLHVVVRHVAMPNEWEYVNEMAMKKKLTIKEVSL